MRSGQLKHRIQIGFYKFTRNEIGESVKTFELIAPTMAKITDAINKENEGTRDQGAIMCRFEFRYSKAISAINTKNIIKYNGSEYLIKSVENYQRMNRRFICMAELQDP